MRQSWPQACANKFDKGRKPRMSLLAVAQGAAISLENLRFNAPNGLFNWLIWP
jgi:hypothetical protein